MKNIGIVINTLLAGGAEKQAVLLSNILSNQYKIYLFVLYGEYIEDRLYDLIDKSRIRVIFFKGNILNTFIQLYKYFKNEHIEIVFSYLAQANILACIVGRLSKAEKLFSGIRSARVPVHKRLVLRFIHNYCNSATVFNNYSGRNLMVKYGFKPEKAVVIPNCILIPESKPIKISDCNPVVIFSLGRFIPIKNYILAIDSVRDVVNELGRHKIEYVIAGYGPEEEILRNKIHDYKLSDVISIVKNPINIAKLFLNSDIFLSTSIYEGTSNAIMEAMTYELPVVATDAGDSRLLVLNGISGYLTAVFDRESIANCLIKLIKSAEIRKNFGTRGYKLITTKYSERRFKDKYVKLIESKNYAT